MSQGQKIINYIRENGSITPMEAFAKLRITKLSTRIGELERRGEVKFVHFMETSVNEEGEKSRYMRYFLDK